MALFLVFLTKLLTGYPFRVKADKLLGAQQHTDDQTKKARKLTHDNDDNNNNNI